jgi:hypothetical protein
MPKKHIILETKTYSLYSKVKAKVILLNPNKRITDDIVISTALTLYDEYIPFEEENKNARRK